MALSVAENTLDLELCLNFLPAWSFPSLAQLIALEEDFLQGRISSFYTNHLDFGKENFLNTTCEKSLQVYF